MGLYAGWRVCRGNYEADIGDSRRQDEHINRVGQLSKLRMEINSSEQFTYSVVQENTVMNRGDVTENEPFPPPHRAMGGQ